MITQRSHAIKLYLPKIDTLVKVKCNCVINMSDFDIESQTSHDSHSEVKIIDDFDIESVGNDTSEVIESDNVNVKKRKSFCRMIISLILFFLGIGMFIGGIFLMVKASNENYLGAGVLALFIMIGSVVPFVISISLCSQP